MKLQFFFDLYEFCRYIVFIIGYYNFLVEIVIVNYYYMFGDMGFYKDILEIDYDVLFFLFRYLICYLLVFYLYNYE